MNVILSQLQLKITKSCGYVHTWTRFFKDTQTQISTMSHLKIYVADLRIFKKYPLLKVIEYDQNTKVYEKAAQSWFLLELAHLFCYLLV